MTEDILKIQCPACGGPVHFDVDKQVIICDYCETTYPEDFFDKKEDAPEQVTEPIDWKKAEVTKEDTTPEPEMMEMQSGFNCTSCGAEIVSDANTAATECMYCGNPIVMTNNVTGMVKPDFILPFKLDKKDAEQRLREFYGGKILLPSTFKSQNRISKIAGVYVPFWLFSGKGSGGMTFDARQVNTRVQGDYNVTTTRYYSARREGSAEFTKIPVDASTKMDDNYMDGLEPYNYDELKEFSSSYMAGFFADKFDVSVEDSTPRAKTRIINSTKDAMKATVTGYTSVGETSSSIDMTDESIHYALLPVWMLNTKYNGKMYKFAINGQTGKVSGDLPIDKTKRNLLFLGITAAGYLLGLLIMFLFVL